jgi:solute carrier family 25 (mitochondrial phosphate transporter), member 23/24/25/41
MDFPDSLDAREDRIEHLWRKLDPKGKGELDFNGLKKGLIRIDHRKQSQADAPRSA